MHETHQTDVLRAKHLHAAVPQLCLRKRYATYEIADRCRWAMMTRSKVGGDVVWCEGCGCWHVRRML